MDVVGDSAFAYKAMGALGHPITLTSRLRANAVISAPKPPPTGKRGRPRVRIEAALADRVGVLRYGPHGGSPVLVDLVALVTLPAGADEAGGPPPLQVLRATGQPPWDLLLGPTSSVPLHLSAYYRGVLDEAEKIGIRYPGAMPTVD